MFLSHLVPNPGLEPSQRAAGGRGAGGGGVADTKQHRELEAG